MFSPKQVDISALLASPDDGAELQTIGRAIYDAMKEDYFVILRNTGLRTEKYDKSLGALKDFLHLNNETKNTVAFDVVKTDGVPYGYHGVTLDSTDVNADGPEVALVESLCFNPSDGIKYPDDLPNLRNDFNSFWVSCRDVSFLILQCLGQLIKQDRTFFNQFHKKQHLYMLRASFHQAMTAQSLPAKFTRFGDHIDFTTFSFIMPQEEVGGLEILHPKLGWIEPAIDADTVILIPGEVLQIWLHGDLKTPRHRVILPADERRFKSRHSQIFFFAPDIDASLIGVDGKPDEGCKFDTFGDLCADKVSNAIGSSRR